MSLEIRISFVILLVGSLAAGAYWYSQELTQLVVQTAVFEEKVILPRHPVSVYQQIPAVQRYLADVKKAIQRGQSILPLQDREIDDGGRRAQKILLKDAQFLEDTMRDGQFLHNDMMSLRPAIVSVLNTQEQLICKSHACYQAEKYNFVTNATTRAIVDIDDNTVLSVKHYPAMQPDISLRLTRIARQIVINAPEIKQALTFTPSLKDISMANVRAALQQSPCENSVHLCVAPIIADHEKQRALWAIVDLTDLKLAAAKWAGLGKTTTPACISERSLQNRVIMENYCKTDTVLEKNGWKLIYRLTGSDGLEVRDVYFHRQKVLTSAKIVDWHVSYQQQEGVVFDTTVEAYIEGRRVEFSRDEEDHYFFGYNDAMGCPMFSTSVVLPFNGPQIREINHGDGSTGFTLTQDFRNPKWPMACNYRYENRFEFYDDGSFRIVGVNLGRGCGDHAIYRPVMRVDMAVDDSEAFYQFQGNQWVQWNQEQHDIQNPESSYYQDKYLYKITAKDDSSRGFYIEPNRGQFNDASRGDHATLFTTVFKPEEGDSDLLTLGSCCNLKQEGMEPYLAPAEQIDGKQIVIWYVPRIHNDTTAGNEYCWADTSIDDHGNPQVKEWPCAVGPKFTPITLSDSE